MIWLPTVFDNAATEINKIYVSAKNGNDKNDGSFNAPVATVEKAKEIVNSAKEGVDTDVYVVLEEGNYFITEPINFTHEDSGVNGKKIIYQGNTYGGTVINGGKEITDFVVTNNIITATTDVSEVRQLYVNGEPATMSVGDEIIATELYSADGKEGIIVNTSSLPQGFENETSAELVYVWEWTKSRFPVKELIALADNKTALVLGEAFSYISNDAKGRITSENADIYLENCVCLTDKAGEFTFDKVKKTITYYKNSGETVNSIFIPVSEGLINICGTGSEKVKNIEFENIIFENGAWNYPGKAGLYGGQADSYYTAAGQQNYKGEGALIPGQISLNNCENIEFKNNTVKNIGSVAFTLNEGVENCVISGNDISNTAAGGVRVGNTKHYTDAYLGKMCSGNKVSNNTIEDISLQYSSSPAITVFYTNATQITHNTIKNTPYSGISLGWGWGTWAAKYCTDNEISYNRIENVMIENGLSTLRDGAHIYTNGQTTNTKIFGNYMIKSSDPTGNKIGGYGGIYLDNGSCNITAYNNVIEECDRWLCVPDKTVGRINLGDTDGDDKPNYSEEVTISFYDNYSDTTSYEAESPYITIETAGSNTSDAAIEIKNNAGAF